MCPAAVVEPPLLIEVVTKRIEASSLAQWRTLSGQERVGGINVGFQLLDGIGQTVEDASGNGYSGTLIRNPVTTAAVFGAGLSFNGVDQYASITPAVPPIENSNFTLSAWVDPPLRTPPGSGADNDAYYGIAIKTGCHLGLYYSRTGGLEWACGLAGTST